MYSLRNAWASLHLLGQADTFLAAAGGRHDGPEEPARHIRGLLPEPALPDLDRLVQVSAAARTVLSGAR
jgi:hypothetical protein